MVSFTLNNRQVSVDADPGTPLLWAIRDHVGLTGTKYGCGAGLCGACTIHVDGIAQRSCQVDVGSVAGKTVVTIEGLSPNSSHPLQKAWVSRRGAAMRLLPVGADHEGRGTAGQESQAFAR
jgi:isoquinoline 1-oxidoreductase alpha subunit